MTELPESAGLLPFNDAATPLCPVVYRLPEAEKQRRRELYTAYYDQQISYIREYFDIKGYETANAFLDVLLECKERGKYRKDGYTPNYGHEIDQVLRLIDSVESGRIDVKAAEKQYGSIEAAFISVIVHDLGEDFGMMPSDLDLKARGALRKSIGSYDEKHMRFIKRGMQSMERLTHDRHYSIEEFQKKFNYEFSRIYDEDLSFPEVPENGDPVLLNQNIRDFLWKKMDVIENPFDPEKESYCDFNMQAFVFMHKGKPRITVTRYGQIEQPGADWNLYMRFVMRDAYDSRNKAGDSGDGMTSRAAIESFTVTGYDRYLRKRAQIFDLSDARYRLQERFPELSDDYASLGGIMGVAHDTGRILINCYPDLNEPGQSGFSAMSLPLDDDGVIHIDPKDHYELAFGSFSLVPGLSNPFVRFLQQYRDVADFFEGHPWHKSAEYLRDQAHRVFIKHGSKYCHLENGFTLADLIDKPERYDPMPALLERLRRESPRPAPEADPVP